MKKVNDYNKRKAVHAMRWFLNELAKEYAPDKKIHLHEGKNFATNIYNDRTKVHEDFEFIYNIDDLIKSGTDYKNGFGYVCAHMMHHDPSVRGFAQVTRILLHEFGHQMTYDDIMRLYGGPEQMDRFYAGTKGRQSRYVFVPTEWVATQWGVDWLKDPQHRKIAKQFEKKFFACFE